MFETASDSGSHHLAGHMVVQEGLVQSPVGTRLRGVAIQLLTLPLLEDSLQVT